MFLFRDTFENRYPLLPHCSRFPCHDQASCPYSLVQNFIQPPTTLCSFLRPPVQSRSVLSYLVYVFINTQKAMLQNPSLETTSQLVTVSFCLGILFVSEVAFELNISSFPFLPANLPIYPSLFGFKFMASSFSHCMFKNIKISLLCLEILRSCLKIHTVKRFYPVPHFLPFPHRSVFFLDLFICKFFECKAEASLSMRLFIWALYGSSIVCLVCLSLLQPYFVLPSCGSTVHCMPFLFTSKCYQAVLSVSLKIQNNLAKANKSKVLCLLS